MVRFSLFLEAVSLATGCSTRPGPGPGDEENPAPEQGLEQLTAHKWWTGRMTAGDVKRIVLAIASPRSPRRECLLLTKDGNLTDVTDGADGGRSAPVPPEFGYEPPKAMVDGVADASNIVFLPRNAMSFQEGAELLQKMLDEAQASDEQYRKTGRGNTPLDQLSGVTFDDTIERENLRKVREANKSPRIPLIQNAGRK